MKEILRIMFLGLKFIIHAVLFVVGFVALSALLYIIPSWIKIALCCIVFLIAVFIIGLIIDKYE